MFWLKIYWILLQNSSWDTCCEIALRWMTQNLTNEKSTLVQVMAWCCQAICHYTIQCWPRSMLPYSVTRPQRIDCDIFSMSKQVVRDKSVSFTMSLSHKIQCMILQILSFQIIIKRERLAHWLPQCYWKCKRLSMIMTTFSASIYDKQFNETTFLILLPEASFGLRVLSLPACVCVCVYVCVSVCPSIMSLSVR